MDLFVRPSNKIAFQMYKHFGKTLSLSKVYNSMALLNHLGYEIYQTVNKYYSSSNGKSEDAYGYLMNKREYTLNLLEITLTYFFLVY